MAKVWNLSASLTIQEDSNDIVTESLEVEETINESFRMTYTIADGTTDKGIDLADIGTCEQVFISSSDEIEVKLNFTSNPAFRIKNLYIDGASVTKIYITNSSGNSVNLKVIVGG